MLHPPREGVVQRAMEEMEEEERVEGRGSGEGGKEWTGKEEGNGGQRKEG